MRHALLCLAACMALAVGGCAADDKPTITLDAGVTASDAPSPIDAAIDAPIEPPPCPPGQVRDAAGHCVPVTLPANQRRLDVAAQAAGGGDVGTDAGIACQRGWCSGGVERGRVVAVTASPDVGYRFDAWSGDGECAGATANPLPVRMTEDRTCTAHFVRRYRVDAVGEGGPAGLALVATATAAHALCAGASCTVDIGSAVALTAPAIDGYRFRGWSGAGCEATALVVTLAQVEGDTTCTARYVRRVTIGAQLAGAPGPSWIRATAADPTAACADSACTVDLGTEVTLEPVVAADRRHAGWSGPGCEGGVAGASLTLTAGVNDVTCTASFVQRHRVGWTVTGPAGVAIAHASSSPAFACTDASCTVDRGAPLTLTAPEVEGWRFDRWQGAGGGGVCNHDGAQLDLASVQVDVTCEARYVQRYRVSIAINDEAAGQVALSTSSPHAACSGRVCYVDDGSYVGFSAAPNPTYQFIWWEEPLCRAFFHDFHVSIVSDLTCTARFAARVTVQGFAMPLQGGDVALTSTSPTADCTAGRCVVDPGARVTLTAKAASEAYRFDGWDGDAPCTGHDPQLVLDDVQASVTCKARFIARIQVTGVMRESRRGTIAAASEAPFSACSGARCVVDVGQRVTLTASLEPGYAVSSWNACAQPIPESEVTVDAAATTVPCILDVHPTWAGTLDFVGTGDPVVVDESNLEAIVYLATDRFGAPGNRVSTMWRLRMNHTTGELSSQASIVDREARAGGFLESLLPRAVGPWSIGGHLVAGVRRTPTAVDTAFAMSSGGQAAQIQIGAAPMTVGAVAPDGWILGTYGDPASLFFAHVDDHLALVDATGVTPYCSGGAAPVTALGVAHTGGARRRLVSRSGDDLVVTTLDMLDDMRVARQERYALGLPYTIRGIAGGDLGHPRLVLVGTIAESAAPGSPTDGLIVRIDLDGSVHAQRIGFPGAWEAFEDVTFTALESNREQMVVSGWAPDAANQHFDAWVLAYAGTTVRQTLVGAPGCDERFVAAVGHDPGGLFWVGTLVQAGQTVKTWLVRSSVLGALSPLDGDDLSAVPTEAPTTAVPVTVHLGDSCYQQDRLLKQRTVVTDLPLDITPTQAAMVRQTR